MEEGEKTKVRTRWTRERAEETRTNEGRRAVVRKLEDVKHVLRFLLLNDVPGLGGKLLESWS